MLNWSATGYKFTLGIGSLALTAMFADRWKDTVPVWVILIVVMLPIVAFIFFRADELPERIVRAAHVFGAAWYVVVAAGLMLSLFTAPNWPRGWVIYPIFVAIGLVPCLIVIARTVGGTYRVDAPDPSGHGRDK